MRDLDGVVIVEDEDGGFHASANRSRARSSSGPRRDDARVAAGRVSDQHGSIDADLEVVHGYLSSSYWAAGVPEDVVRRSIENSLCFGVYRARSRPASRGW